MQRNSPKVTKAYTRLIRPFLKESLLTSLKSNYAKNVPNSELLSITHSNATAAAAAKAADRRHRHGHRLLQRHVRQPQFYRTKGMA